MKILDIFKYDNYKVYVRDWIQSHDRGGRGLYRKIAEDLRLSYVMVSQIFSGDRHLSPERAFRLAKFLGLSDSQCEYFRVLVALARAGTEEYRNYLLSQVEKMQVASRDLTRRLPQDHQLSEVEKARFYSHWAYSAVRLAVSLPDVRDLDALSGRLQISKEMVQQIVEFLIGAGLLIEEGGRYKMGPQRLHLEASSPYIHSRQVSWRFKAMHQMNFKKPDDLYYTGSLSVSRAAQKEFRSSLVQLFEEMSNRVTREEPEVLVALNVDYFEI